MSDDTPRNDDAGRNDDATEATPPRKPVSAAAPQPYQAATRSSPWGHVFFAGLLLLLTGLSWWWVEDATSVVLRVWLFAGLVATLAPFFWHIVDIVQAVMSRRGAASGFVILTTILGFVAFGIVTQINIKKGKGVWSADTTSTGKFTLGDATEKLLTEVPGTVYMTYLEHVPTNPALRGAAQDQISMYAAYSDRVKVEIIQPLTEPERAQRYLREVGVNGTSSGESDDVLVLSYAEPGKQPVPGRQKEIRVERYSWVKASRTGDEKWMGERLISDAIMELVFRRYKVYATGGHGERVLTEEMRELRSALLSQNIEVVERAVDLRSSPNVPEDCDVLMILDPQASFSTEECRAINEYLERGRTLFVALDVLAQGRSVGLEPVLEPNGIRTRLNYRVIAPYLTASGPTKQLWEPSQTLLVGPTHYADHPAVAALRARAGFGTAFQDSTYFEIDDEASEGLDVQGVVFAPFIEGLDPPGFCARVEPGRTEYGSPDPDKDVIGGRRAIVVTAVHKVRTAPGEGDRDARIVAFGDTDVLTNQMIAQVPPNLDLAMGFVQWGLRREGLVAVSERTIETEVVSLGVYAQKVAMAWPLAVALLALIVGGLVWWSRRR